MFKKRQVYRPLVIMVVLLGLVSIYFLSRYMWKIWNNNAFDIITELVFPAGKLYYSEASIPRNSETTENAIQEDMGLREFNSVRETNQTVNALTDYSSVIEKYYVISSSTTLSEDVLDLEELISMDLTLEQNQDEPQILVFHAHGQEGFADTEETGKTIVDAGEYLCELLRNEYGYNVMHITESFDLVNGVLDRSTAYTYANERLEEILAENPSIEVVIDLHRDGVDENTHLVTDIDGRKTAKLMFFNGISYTNEQGELQHLQNPYLSENLAMSYQMMLLGENLYPDLMRCIYIEGYRYCLHHRARSMLVEAGAQTNTYEEIQNAMIPLARMLALELGYEE